MEIPRCNEYKQFELILINDTIWNVSRLKKNIILIKYERIYRHFNESV